MVNPADALHLRGIREQTLSVLRETIGEGSQVALLDVSNQGNAGDSLIYAGQLNYFRELGLRLRYASDMRGYSTAALRRALPEGVVLLQGGGNFGDLWRGHQKFRDRVALDLPDHRIVQLPQSVHFDNPERAARTNEVLGSHPDFTLLLRDTESMRRAATDTPSLKARFCPDAALGWEPPRSWVAATGPVTEVLVLRRKDKEGSSGLSSVKQGWIPGVRLRRTDWTLKGRELRRLEAARAVLRWQEGLAAGSALQRRLHTRIPNGLARGLLSTVNHANLDGALKIYAGTGLAVVDRLHAHILACLLGVEHIVLDNSYGKISAVHRDYTGGFSTAHHATSLTEAAAIATRLVDH
jgi:pyruvyl transferase EpsO